MKFKCCWCNHIFDEDVVYKDKSKKGTVSSTIECGKCGRTIPASAKEIADSVGRKHIHIRKWGGNKMLYGTDLVKAR